MSRVGRLAGLLLLFPMEWNPTKGISPGTNLLWTGWWGDIGKCFLCISMCHWFLGSTEFLLFFVTVQSFPRTLFISLQWYIYYFCCFCVEAEHWDLLTLHLVNVISLFSRNRNFSMIVLYHITSFLITNNILFYKWIY